MINVAPSKNPEIAAEYTRVPYAQNIDSWSSEESFGPGLFFFVGGSVPVKHSSTRVCRSGDVLATLLTLSETGMISKKSFCTGFMTSWTSLANTSLQFNQRS